ncbi:hypothetical protein [Slackia exigua]
MSIIVDPADTAAKESSVRPSPPNIVTATMASTAVPLGNCNV